MMPAGLRSTPCFQRGGTSPRISRYFLDQEWRQRAWVTEVLSELLVRVIRVPLVLWSLKSLCHPEQVSSFALRRNWRVEGPLSSGLLRRFVREFFRCTGVVRMHPRGKLPCHQLGVLRLCGTIRNANRSTPLRMTGVGIGNCLLFSSGSNRYMPSSKGFVRTVPHN